MLKCLLTFSITIIIGIAQLCAQPGNGNGNGNNDCKEPPCGKGPGNGGPPGNPTVPIDEHLYLLVVAGVGYGVHKLANNNRVAQR